jgi:hypothetical protein
LDEIREHFRLPKDENFWPAILVERGVSVETFLDFVLDRITPFVEMVLDLYSFFSKHVSTAGGRTTHFEVRAEAIKRVLQFPNIDLPRRVKWVEAWETVRLVCCPLKA